METKTLKRTVSNATTRKEGEDILDTVRCHCGKPSIEAIVDRRSNPPTITGLCRLHQPKKTRMSLRDRHLQLDELEVR